MNLDDISAQIELELHNYGKLSKQTINDIDQSIKHQMKQFKGGNPAVSAGLKVIQMSGIDKLLIRTIAKNITKTVVKSKMLKKAFNTILKRTGALTNKLMANKLMKAIVHEAYKIFPSNPNIYLSAIRHNINQLELNPLVKESFMASLDELSTPEYRPYITNDNLYNYSNNNYGYNDYYDQNINYNNFSNIYDDRYYNNFMVVLLKLIDILIN